MMGCSVFRYSKCDFVLEVPKLKSRSHPDIMSTSSFLAEPDGAEADSPFDFSLKSKWNDAKVKGLFRYDLDDLKTRILPGKFSFVAQLNTKRATERRKPQSITNILQPFNPNIFNFTKANPEEILFGLQSNLKQASGAYLCDDEMKKLNHLVFINISPLEYCNSLLVPNIDKCSPQVLDEEGLCLAVELVLLSSTPSMRVGFNSLCAYASVNHYHFHLFYLSHPLYLETVAIQHIARDCFEVSDYAVPGFVFVMDDGDVNRIARSVVNVASIFKDNNVPYNLFITRGAKADEVDQKVLSALRIYLWPRKPCDDDKDKGAFNVACCEISGHLPIKNEVSFELITEADVVVALRETCTLTFTDIRPKVVAHLNKV